MRQNLAKSKSEISKLHVEKVQLEDSFKTHQTNKEKELAKEVSDIGLLRLKLLHPLKIYCEHSWECDFQMD